MQYMIEQDIVVLSPIPPDFFQLCSLCIILCLITVSYEVNQQVKLLCSRLITLLYVCTSILMYRLSSLSCCLVLSSLPLKLLSHSLSPSKLSNVLMLQNIIGPEAGKHIIQEYLQRRGYVDSSPSIPDEKPSSFQAYTKPHSDENGIATTKRQTRIPKEAAIPLTKESKSQRENAESSNNSRGSSKVSKKKKAGKAISLAEAAKGSVVFRQGQPCSCQARRHKLVSNCLSCGKIVCEQEGEGPCSFCGALVLREGSTYAGLEDLAGPLSDAEAAAEAYAKRLVDYDRNSAARTTVIDDQSDYYEFEGNTWLSEEVFPPLELPWYLISLMQNNSQLISSIRFDGDVFFHELIYYITNICS